MNTRVLLKLSFIISLIGLFSLIFLADLLEPDQIGIYEILNNTQKYSGTEIKIVGIVSEIKNFSSEDIFFKLNEENQSIDVQGNFVNTKIDSNLTYEVIGVLQEYNERIYVDARKIKRI